jgi:Ca2+-transporting ATPase
MPKRKQRKLSRKAVPRQRSEERLLIEEVSAVNAASEKAWHKMTASDVLAVFDSSSEGISQGESVARLKEHGPNEIREAPRATAAELFIAQFRSLLVVILIIALLIAAVLGEVFDAVVIFAIVILNALLGFSQEWKAEKALDALKKLAAPKAKVIRGGAAAIVNATELVPGDIVLLSEGDRVPADCRLVEQLNLKCDESVLTGESTPVTKSEKTLKKEAIVAERQNMIFAGTTAVYGHCKAVVTGTGMDTEFGKIAAGLAAEEEPTPLQIKLNTLGKQLGEIVLVIAGIIFIAGFLAGVPAIAMFLTAVALAVAAIPEGLPAVVTISLAQGVHKMAAKNAIVRRLASVETLGAATYICSDKTGTMTLNEMTVRKLYVDGKTLDVTGEGYNGRGKFYFEGKEVDITKLDDAKLLLASGLLCNDSLTDAGIIGDPTEAALVVSAKKAGFEDLRRQYQRTDELPFDSKRKMMSVSVTVGKKNVMYTKGALEAVLAKCTHIIRNGQIQRLTSDDRDRIIAINRQFAQGALRVLAFAVKKNVKEARLAEEGLTFIGMQGMSDLPRPEVKDAIRKCRLAGINVVMITGDHRDTAVAIAKELGLVDSEEGVLTGEQLDRIGEAQFDGVVEKVRVYARVSPDHKVRITEALKKKGHIVAMTGDGINDAPALKKADIGIAMGVTGTDVTREAADLILTDDNFATIVSAVEEGRNIFTNISKFIRYLLSANMGEVLAIFAAMMLSLFFQNAALLLLLPVQILWMNLVTDGLPAVALSAEPAEPGVMARKPKDPHEPIMGRKNFAYIFGVAVLMAIGSVGLFFLKSGQIAVAQTVAFTALVFFQMAIAYSVRSEKPVWKANVLGNKKLMLAVASSIALQLIIIYVAALNPAFKTAPLDALLLVEIVAATLVLFAILEAAKLVSAYKKQKGKMKVTTEGFSE